MHKSASAPSANFAPFGSQQTSSSLSLANVERDKLPIGVSRLVASRMRLDATLAPSMLGLRMNTQNLINEMQYNGGKIVSHQFALMRPRRNTRWEKPKEMTRDGKGREKEIKRLHRKINRENTQRMAHEKEVAEEAAYKAQHAPAAHAKMKATTEDEDIQLIQVQDKSLAEEIDVISKNPRVAEIWQMMQPQADEAAGEVPVVGLPRSRLARALEALGYGSADAEAVEEALEALPGTTPLLLDEFISIVAVFKRQRRVHFREHFERLDDDHSGNIGMREFRHLLWDLGYTVTEETVMEYLNECDDDHSGEVEFAEFEHACHLVHQRHGFSIAEVEAFEELFDKYDADGSNEMEADELASAMGWFGCATTLEQASQIIARFDEDGDGCIAKPEFLLIMRQRLEDEISEMRSLFHDFDTDESGTMDGEELIELFMKCGYTITGEVIEDAVKAALPNCYNRKNVELVFEDVLKVFYLVRKREGFSGKELDELTDVYNRHDKGGKGELREFELARCFNWMGYPLSNQRRREMWCKIDVDKTENIDPGEFLKLVRLLREEETNAARELLAQGPRGPSSLSESALRNMLIGMGYSPHPNIITAAMKQSGDSSGDGSVDLQGVLGILRFIREKQVVKLRQSAGISDQQANKVKGKFGMRIENGKHIEFTEFEKLMYDLFPVARHDQSERDKIKTIIKQQATGDNIKDLMEAYWIVRLYGDMRDEDKWTREQEAATAAGFTHWQVASFREAFGAADPNSDGCLSERQIQQVLSELMTLSLHQFESLSREFHKLGDKRDTIEFCDFLKLIKTVLREGRPGGHSPAAGH